MPALPFLRRHLLALPLVAALPTLAGAAALATPSRSAMLAFDALYIPPLFLSGSAGKSAEGPAKARAAMQRLMAQWPAQRRALLAAVPGERRWGRSLDAVEGKLQEADALMAQARWEPSHEVLEHVREILFTARRSLDLDYPLDHFTAFHTAMEKLANASTVRRPGFDTDYAAARALWRRIEALSFDPAEYGLSAERAAQLARARLDESEALSRLSQALRAGSEADLLKAAAATKPPFVRAYLAFGSPL